MKDDIYLRGVNLEIFFADYIRYKCHELIISLYHFNNFYDVHLVLRRFFLQNVQWIRLRLS